MSFCPAPSPARLLVLGILLLALTTTAFASSFSGTLSNTNATLTWNSTQTGVIGETQTGTGVANPPCNATICDLYNLTVNVPATFYATYPNFAVHVAGTWASSLNEIDVYVYDANNNVVGMATQSNATYNDADLGQLPSGNYQIQMVPAIAANTAYTGTVTLAAEPSIASGKARYKGGNATFTEQKLTRPAGVYNTSPAGPVFFEQDAEPRVVHDGVGNLYVAAIQGIPGGTDTWKSIDGGNAFSYLGEPDGAQAAGSGFGLVGVGAGGGDEDIITLPNGHVVMTSLWLGSNTTCVSSNGGTTWLCNPNGSTLPADDRQWLANYGSNIVYITSKQLGADLNGTVTLYVAKSIDGGVTFPLVSAITTPELGVQPGDQGNLVVDQNNGNVYNVFFSSTGTQLYIAKSVDGGQSWMLKLAFQSPNGDSLVNVFPSVALDKAGNIYIAFSDGHNSYLTHSTDGAASFSKPVIVNQGANLKTTVEPWVVAGDAGKVNIFYYGTSEKSANSATAHWQIYMAQIQNALAPIPTVAISTATPVMHIGAICNHGLACANGTRNLLEYFYPDTYLNGNAMATYPDDLHVDPNTTITSPWFLKQTGGSTITR